MLFLPLCDISVVIVFTSIVFAVKADVSPTMTGNLFIGVCENDLPFVTRITEP